MPINTFDLKKTSFFYKKYFTVLLLLLFTGISAPLIAQKLKPADLGIKSKKALNYYLDGEAFTRMRDRRGAINAYKQALSIEPNFVMAHYRVGVNAYVLKNYGEAIKHLQIVHDLKPGEFTNFYLAEAYFYNAKYSEAIPCYERYLDENRTRESDRLIAALNLRHSRFAAEAIKKPISFEPQNLGVKINSQFEEYLPYLNADDSYLLFTGRRKEAIGGYSKQLQGYGEDFYISEKDENGEWKQAKNLGAPINTVNNEGAASISQDGRKIFFAACNRSDGVGSCDLYYAIKEGDRWSEAVNLGRNVNSDGWDSQPCLSHDGKTLYFTSARSGGEGTLDIWYSELINDVWQPAKNLGKPVNTPGQESSPFMHADGQSLYFSSNFHPGFGSKDLFVSHRQEDGSWGEPENLGYPLNTVAEESHIFITAKGDKGFINSDREGGLGGSDLYEFVMDESIRPQMATFLRGTVQDSLTGKPLESLIRLVDVASGDTIRQINSDKINGRFLMSLPLNREYAAFVEAPGYLFGSRSFLLKQQSKEDIYFDLLIELIPIEAGKQVVLENIFFESGKYDLKPESEAELKVLVNFLKTNPSIQIEIQGHTDNVGSIEDNEALSYNRAKAVVQYLSEHGIQSNRLSAEGYGEDSPVASNDTEEGRAINRRTEFKVLTLK